MTDAQLTLAGGVVLAAKRQGATAYTVDIDFLVAVLAELRERRGIARDRISELEAALRFLCQMCLVASVPYDDEADFHRALLLAQKALGTFDPRYRQDG